MHFLMIIGVFFGLFGWAAAQPAEAFVERLEITERTLIGEGQDFGRVGPYVRISGKLHYAIDPETAANSGIVDVDLAPRDARGLIIFSGDFVLLKPANPANGNGRILYDVTNRGGMRALNMLNDAPGGNSASSVADMGNGFLLEQGYAILWTGWNWDVPDGGGLLTIELPIAMENGEPVTGRVLGEIAPMRPMTEAQHIGMFSIGYPPLRRNDPNAVLSVRESYGSTYTPLPRSAWEFGRTVDGLKVDDPGWITLADGFEPGMVYRLRYMAQDSRVVGLGLASIRDALSFFRFETRDSYGHANPLTGENDALPEAVLAYGHSQPARLLNTFIFEGLHVDEQGRMVLDGALIDVAGAGKGSFNFRFAQTSRHFSPDIELDYPTDFFPFTTALQLDPVSGETASLFDRARELNAVPRIMIFNTSTEYWARSASLAHTTVEGNADVDPDPSARIYMLTGGQHLIGTVPTRGDRVNCNNPLDHRPVLRALFSHLDAWVTLDREPPPSRFPRLDGGGLGPIESYQATFPDVPFLRPPTKYLEPPRLDHGDRFAEEGIADRVPPVRGQPYTTLVPLPDTDGIDLAGIRMPDIQVPLGTYTGWNQHNAATGAPERLSRWLGSFLPFARTEAERIERGDPRPSLAQRYATKEDYTQAFAAATLNMAGEELILGLDINPMIERAGAFYDRVLEHEAADESCAYLRAN